MSYCRWSSDNYQCDIYAYRHVCGGYQVHVAGRRNDAPIGLQHDGDRFSLDTAGECADKLIELRACGYNVPQCAIDDLRDESMTQTEPEGGAMKVEGDRTNKDRVFLISADGQHKIDSTVQEVVEMFEFVRALTMVAKRVPMSDDQLSAHLKDGFSKIAGRHDKSKS